MPLVDNIGALLFWSGIKKSKLKILRFECLFDGSTFTKSVAESESSKTKILCWLIEIKTRAAISVGIKNRNNFFIFSALYFIINLFYQKTI